MFSEFPQLIHLVLTLLHRYKILHKFDVNKSDYSWKLHWLFNSIILKILLIHYIFCYTFSFWIWFQVHIHLLQPNLLRLKYNWITHGLEFEGALKWPGTIHIDENGEVTIEFQKETPCEWKYSYTPVIDSPKLPYRLPDHWVAKIEDNSLENNDTSVLTAKFIDNVYFSFGAGTYINIQRETTKRNGNTTLSLI